MARRVKVFVEINDYMSLDRLIGTLTALRDALPSGAEPELCLRGDDDFGRNLSIAYFRDLTEEEAAMERRYAAAQPSSNNSNPSRRARRVACN